MAWFSSVRSFQATCINSLAKALSASSDKSTGKVRRLLDYCPTVPSGDELCVLNDRSLAAVTALGLFAVNSNMKIEQDVIVGYLLRLLHCLPSANWVQNTQLITKKEGMISEQFCYKLTLTLANVATLSSSENRDKIVTGVLDVFEEFIKKNSSYEQATSNEQLTVTIPALIGMGRALYSSITGPREAFRALFDQTLTEDEERVWELGEENTVKLFKLAHELLTSTQWKGLDTRLKAMDSGQLLHLGYPYRCISTVVQYTLTNLIRGLVNCPYELDDSVRSMVHKVSESQMTTGVNELGTMASTGTNERAFHIIKVICVAVENLIWAVKTERESEHAFQKFSSLLTVHTAKFSVLVAPLRAAMLEGIAALAEKSPNLVSLTLNRFKEFLNSSLLFAMYCDAHSSGKGNLDFATAVRPEVFHKLWASGSTAIHISRVDAFVTVHLALGRAVCRALLVGGEANTERIDGFLASLGNQLYTTDASVDRNLRVAECIVMLLGQVAVEVKGRHISQVASIFQQRLFHPTSNLDGNIVRELGKMAAKTGDNGTIDMLIRLMALSLGEPIPAYSKKESSKETSFSHIYQPVVDSLVHVATRLEDKQQRFELLDHSMQLFIQQGIEARRASERAEATSSHKATSSSFSLGLLLPVISTLIEHLDPMYHSSPKVVKLFRDFWLYCIIMRFSDFTIGVFPSAWYTSVREIAVRSPLLLSMGAEQFLDKELEINHPLKIENIATGELQEARQSLVEQLGKSTDLDRLASRLTFVQCMYIQSINRLEALRLERSTETFPLVFRYLEDRGLQGELWIAVEMIANKLFKQFLELMEAKPANASRATELESVVQLLLFKFIHLRGRIKHVADRYLTKLVDKFPHLLWSKTVIHTMLDLLQELSLTLKDLSPREAVDVKLPYLDHSITLPDLFEKREKTVNYFATRCQQIIELAIKWTPSETKAILEDYISSVKTGSVGVIHHSAVSLAASIISNHSQLNQESQHLPPSLTSNRATCIKDSLSQPLSNIYLKSNYMGEVLGMKAALQLSVLEGSAAGRNLSTLLTTQVQNALKSVSNLNQEELSENLLQLLGFVAPTGTFFNPLRSCQDLNTNQSGNFWVRTPEMADPVLLFCDFSRNCSCNTEGAWTRIANIDLINPNDSCPEGLRLVVNTSPPERLCARIEYPGCTSVFFRTHSIPYRYVCGRIRGYQIGSTDAFSPSENAPLRADLEQAYVDGVSLTYSSPRQHIWTFAAARDETIRSCDCTRDDEPYHPEFIAPEVGQDYFCATGSTEQFRFQKLYSDDPLWDGMGCGGNSTCCEFNNPPFFCQTLPELTSSDVEMRLCSDELNGDEDIQLEQIEIYVQ